MRFSTPSRARVLSVALSLLVAVAVGPFVACGARTEFTIGKGGAGDGAPSSTSTANPACADATLGTDALGATGLAVDGTDVYWTTVDGKLMKSASDAPGVALADGLTSPNGVTVFGGNVLWTEETRVVSMPRSGGAMTVVADHQSLPMVVVADASGVWWLNRGDGILAGSVVASLGGGATQIVFDQIDTPSDLAMDAMNLYFAASLARVNDQSVFGPLVRVPKAAGTAELLAGNLHEPAGITVDATNVYWLEQVDAMSSFPGSVRSLPKGGGTPANLASTEQVLPIRIALDETYAYVTGLEGTGADSHGLLWRIALADGAVGEVARTNGAVYGSVVVTATAIYWTIAWSEGKQPPGAPSVRKKCK